MPWLKASRLVRLWSAPVQGSRIVPTEIRLTGGGSKSAVWRQIAADVLGFPTVRCYEVTEGAALGAAIHAAWTYCQVKGKPVSLEKLVDDLVVLDKKNARRAPQRKHHLLPRAAPQTDRFDEKAENRGISVAAGCDRRIIRRGRAFFSCHPDPAQTARELTKALGETSRIETSEDLGGRPSARRAGLGMKNKGNMPRFIPTQDALHAKHIPEPPPQPLLVFAVNM